MPNRIIINGRELNFIQRYFFNKQRDYIEKVLVRYPTMAWLILTGLAVSYNLVNGEIATTALLSFGLLVLYMGYIFIVDKYVIYNLRRSYSVVFGKDKLKLINKYLINYEAMGEILAKTVYYDDDVEINILKKSYGHEVFEEIKAKVFNDCPFVISHMEDPSSNLIEQSIPYFKRHGREFKLKNTFKLNKLSTEELRSIYAKYKGINVKDSFTKTIVDMKLRQELVDILNEKLISKELING